ncbi:MAG TPA: cob(I)yrinic acid a,c-diamide adenosyltransferase [Synergistaceae bacterium]|jgi:cob(I)alamin adenosyltransferase|nr:cob(I)yrinic acid a,c-diamide adenosyltransferase [Synergistaceae bacterium]
MFGERGLVHIYSGDGKGKTTSALGLAMRALGHGARVKVIQFMKGWNSYGELKTALKLEGLEIIQTGRSDYVYKGREQPEDYEEAERGMEKAREVINGGCCDMLILDEINVAIDYGLVSPRSVAELVKNRPFGMELVLTGRGMHQELIALADLVTEMREIKHPYNRGVLARKGVEF